MTLRDAELIAVLIFILPVIGHFVVGHLAVAGGHDAAEQTKSEAERQYLHERADREISAFFRNLRRTGLCSACLGIFFLMCFCIGRYWL